MLKNKYGVILKSTSCLMMRKFCINIGYTCIFNEFYGKKSLESNGHKIRRRI